jgi:hypothetical protein
VIKNKLQKLTLRRETLSALDLQEAQGGSPSFALNTQASICRYCYPKPVLTEETTWPIQTGNPVINPVGF